MNVALGKVRADWRQVRVAAGTFGSVGDAIAQHVSERMAFEDDGLEWVGPLPEERGMTQLRAGRSASMSIARGMWSGWHGTAADGACQPHGIGRPGYR